MCKNNPRELENGCTICDTQPQIPNSFPSRRKKEIYIDEALTKISKEKEIYFGKFNYFIIFVSGMTLCAVLMETLAISFVIPVSTCDLNLTTNEKGIIGASSYLGIICSSHLWGYLADTKGRRRILRPTLLIACILSICSSISQDFCTLAILRFLNGVFMCASSSAIYAYLGEFHDNVQRSRAIMGSAIIFGIAGLLLPLIAWLVINQDWMFFIPLLDIVYKPWRLFLVVCCLPGMFVFIALLFLPESPKFVLGQGKRDEAIKILEKINRWNNGSSASLDDFELCEDAESIENRRRFLDNKNSRLSVLKSIWDQTAPLFQPPYLRPTILICTIQFIIYVTVNGIYMWLPEILNRVAMNLGEADTQRVKMCELINMVPMNVSTESSESEPACAKMNQKLELDTLEQGVIIEVIYAVGFVVIGFLINRIGKFLILFTLLSVCGIGGILCAFVDIPIIFISSFILLMCVGMALNVVNAATVEIYPTNFRAMAISISLMFGRLGSVTGSNMVALLIDNYCDSVFLLSGFSLIGAGILTFFIPKIHEKMTKSNKRKETRASILSR